MVVHLLCDEKSTRTFVCYPIQPVDMLFLHILSTEDYSNLYNSENYRLFMEDNSVVDV